LAQPHNSGVILSGAVFQAKDLACIVVVIWTADLQ
jgi:hypothetical protein